MSLGSAGRHSRELSQGSETAVERLMEISRSKTTCVCVGILRWSVFASLYCGLFAVVCSSKGPVRHARGIYAPEETDDEIAKIRREFGVLVHVKFDPARFFPAHWRVAPASAKGVQIEPAAETQLKRLIPRFLAMYPRGLIANNLRSIYLLKSMSAFGVVYGGSYYRKSIYISSGGDHRVYDIDLLAMMHSEFSSILYRDYGFPAEEWNKINEVGWRYVGPGIDLRDQRRLYVGTETLLRRGFTCAYGTVSLEEDVNMYVLAVIRREASLISAAERHIRVKQKLEILTRFYEKIHKRVYPLEEFGLLIRLKSIIAPARPEERPPIILASQADNSLRPSPQESSPFVVGILNANAEPCFC